jgi:hypothetical protein
MNRGAKECRDRTSQFFAVSRDSDAAGLRFAPRRHEYLYDNRVPELGLADVSAVLPVDNP